MTTASPGDHEDTRGTSTQPGIVSRHCFSSGPYYDPDRMSYGPVVGVDEHLVEPGAGFDWHAHRGVHIASWVLEGTLRHEDSVGEVRFVTPGALFVQTTGDGIRHTETNASDVDPLRFLQITVLGDGPPGVRSAALPARVGDVTIDVRDHDTEVEGFLLLVRGGCSVGSAERVRPGAVLWGGTGSCLDSWEPDSAALIVTLDGARVT